MAKPKIALYWAAACGGCDVAVLDTNEKILDIANLADIVFWPIALDFKYHHVEEMADGSIDLCLFNGAIRNSEQEHIAHLARGKSKVMIAFGTCACFGGIPGLCNFTSKEEIFETVYKETASTINPEFTTPQTKISQDGHTLTLPELYNDGRALSQVVDVDYYLPGCPPAVELIEKLVPIISNFMEKGELPPKGAVIASDKTLCDECPRIKEKKMVSRIFRPHEIIPREPNARESAQLRDLAKEISSAGGCPLEHIDQAFREAAGQVKFHISYVRAVLLDWLGIERNRSP